MEILEIKWIAIGTLFTIAIFLSYAPQKCANLIQSSGNIQHRHRLKRCISFLSCYGGGVFLGASLLDLLPDVRETFDTIKETFNIRTEFPLVEFVVSLGFFIVFIIEQFVLAYKESGTILISEREALLSSQDGADYSSIDDRSMPPINDDEHDHNLMLSMHEDPSSHSVLRSLILSMALCLHSVFEGLAIGLQMKFDHLLQLLVAVFIHKGIIALSLGVNIMQSQLRWKLKAVILLVFSFASPVGIGIGMEISSLSGSTLIANGILQGFACGTFIYVTFFEVIPHELNHKRDRLMKLLCIILGFATICGAMFLELS